jgi:hypothetical protein
VEYRRRRAPLRRNFPENYFRRAVHHRSGSAAEMTARPPAYFIFTINLFGIFPFLKTSYTA